MVERAKKNPAVEDWSDGGAHSYQKLLCRRQRRHEPNPGQSTSPREATESHKAFHLFTFALTPRCIEHLHSEAGPDLFLAIAKACGAWMQRIENRPICIDCDLEFSRHHLPAGFTVAVPFADADSPAMVGGICDGCLGKEGLDARIFQRLKSIWPDLRVSMVEGGHA